MAYPTIAVVNTAINALYDLFAANKTSTKGRYMIGLLNKIGNEVKAKYTPLVDFTITDATDADLAAFYAADGELGVALERPAQVGDVFSVTGTGDTTDNALATAKGGAVADNDVFIVSGAAAVVYLGVTGTPVTVTDNETVDFVSLGA
jgi:bifunctional ADP-heptose synthase (sugar kinase/adenylyltransferase)